MKIINKTFWIICLLALFVFASIAFAQDKVGTSAAPFLGISIGAQAGAMGGAGVSTLSDASVVYWNPGSISRLAKSYVNFTHTKWFVDTDYNWAGVVLNMGGVNAIALNLAILDYGEEDVTTVRMPDGTGERWSAKDLYFAATYARNLTDRFSMGGTVKIIQQSIYNESATGYAVDLGLLYITRFNGMRLGMSISNYGSDMKMDGKDLVVQYDPDAGASGNNSNIGTALRTYPWALPLFYRVGVSMDVLQMGESSLMLAMDAVIPSDNSTILNVGAEFNWNKVIFIRGGFKSLTREETEEGLTAGMGIHYFVPGLGNVAFDYVYNDYGLLEEVHTLGIGISF